MRIVISLLAVAFVLISQAKAVTLAVPGTGDLWLAGMPDGSTASYSDIAPAQSPAQVLGLDLSPGIVLIFSASGLTTYDPEIYPAPPDGLSYFIVNHSTGAENGISDVIAPMDSLVGLFLDSEQPDSSSAPQTLDFTSNRDYLSLAPALKQVFFIGDGLTSTGTQQQIVVPAGASRLFLGTMDTNGWYNNAGSFSVTVNSIPEPYTIALLGIGAISQLTYVWRRRKRLV
ncbi:MAG: PEP-CTERM sorting domain-containing protein [Thermoguttaceae bacterium]|jgi:hypothetical protein